MLHCSWTEDSPAASYRNFFNCHTKNHSSSVEGTPPKHHHSATLYCDYLSFVHVKEVACNFVHRLGVGKGALLMVKMIQSFSDKKSWHTTSACWIFLNIVTPNNTLHQREQLQSTHSITPTFNMAVTIL